MSLLVATAGSNAGASFKSRRDLEPRPLTTVAVSRRERNRRTRLISNVGGPPGLLFLRKKNFSTAFMVSISPVSSCEALAMSAYPRQPSLLAHARDRNLLVIVKESLVPRRRRRQGHRRQSIDLGPMESVIPPTYVRSATSKSPTVSKPALGLNHHTPRVLRLSSARWRCLPK